MALAMRPVVSAPLAGCCTVLSVFGVFGLAFSGRTEAMTGSTNDPDDPTAVAHVCYMAAAVYAAFLVFCGCQMMVHRRYPRGVQL
ncbi:hypothetical protein FFLO_02887 [Filobasidium floriforme]|uniref:Uncharacterized protein n=1 Tax=Filobasidium floriforme TaxID=5210 RepID=A0A8K0JNV3_9TREE|nr:uncharacterized protein HD553DRAFT_306590 [Filobasidium floriforme]KAG7558234.1 hypothetical protein FFLO_02887 [Filobasidium floriforme]KAH8088495.1 hypothetical protein HD553DRAFT_306590 [Filobasidium floriforme]